MPIYSVRQIFQWRPSRDQKMKHVYDERITMWRAESFEHAINKAEARLSGRLLRLLPGQSVQQQEAFSIESVTSRIR